MTGPSPKQLGRIGMFYMEEAVLDALTEAKQDQAFGPPEVMRRTGVVSGVAQVPDGHSRRRLGQVGDGGKSGAHPLGALCDFSHGSRFESGGTQR